jgi:hypothetical protein
VVAPSRVPFVALRPGPRQESRSGSASPSKRRSWAASVDMGADCRSQVERWSGSPRVVAIPFCVDDAVLVGGSKAVARSHPSAGPGRSSCGSADPARSGPVSWRRWCRLAFAVRGCGWCSVLAF